MPCSSEYFFLNCYLTVPQPTFGHSQGDSLTNPMLITAFVHVWPKGHRKPRNEVGFLSLAKCLAGSEPGTFRFLLLCLNPLGHSSWMVYGINYHLLGFWVSKLYVWFWQPAFLFYNIIKACNIIKDKLA